MTQHARQLGLFEQATQMDHEGGAEDARMVKTPEQVTALCQRLEAAPVAAIPSVNETGDLDGVGICLRPGKAWIVPLIESNVALSEVVSALIQVPVVVAHDVKKLLHALDRENVTCQATFFDVMVAAHLCNVPMSQLNLTELAAKFLVPSPAPKSDASGWGSTSTAAALITQAETLWQLHIALTQKLAEQGTTALFTDLEMPLLQVLFEMEHDGVTIDTPYLQTLSTELGQTISQLEKRIFVHSSKPFNVGSPAQLSKVLFEELGLPTDKLNKTWRGGNISTSVWSLDVIKALHPIIPLVLEHRELSKLKGTYTNALPAILSPRDGRLHTTFAQVNTATGRLSSLNPNLQNIPIVTEMGRRVQQVFIARNGGIIISADYSQIELRVVAHLANDAALIAAFEQGEDIHARTAATVYGVGLDQVTVEQRVTPSA